jgi:hypothetical protein
MLIGADVWDDAVQWLQGQRVMMFPRIPWTADAYMGLYVGHYWQEKLLGQHDGSVDCPAMQAFLSAVASQ